MQVKPFSYRSDQEVNHGAMGSNRHTGVARTVQPSKQHPALLDVRTACEYREGHISGTELLTIPNSQDLYTGCISRRQHHDLSSTV